MRGAGGMGGINLRLMMQAWRLQALEARLLAAKGALSEAELRARASEKLRQGANLTRAEVAAVIGVSVKKVQRMDAAGTLSRCRNLGTVVRYAARDVLRLASAR